MVVVRTDLGDTREAARRERFEPVSGNSATNVQKAIENAAGSNSVTNTDGSLSAFTIMGATVVSLNPSHSNTWAATQTFTKGNLFVANNIGTVSSGTLTPDPTQGNYQFYTNGGAHTLAVPSVDSAIDILVTNNASAGAVAFSGFTVGANTGDALDTINGHKFLISIRRLNSVSMYNIQALQ